MGKVRDRVGLRINGQEWHAWDGVSITRGLDQLCTSAKLSLYSVDWESGRWREPVPGDACELHIGPADTQVLPSPSDRLIFTGAVFTDEDDGVSGCAYEVELLSRLADAVHCTHLHPTGVFKGQRVEGIARALFEPYGVGVLCDVDTGAPVPLFRSPKTETPAKAVMRLARERGLLLLETPSGDLQITRLAQPGTAVAILQRGARPLKRLRRRRDVSERHAHYHVRGQSADDFALEVGVLDLWSGLRNRTLRIDHDRAANREACERRALWEAMTRAGKSIRYTADLYGWRVDPTDGTSTIWAPNQLVHVVDPRYRLDDDLVVARVTLSKSAQSGTTTALELAYPDGLQPEPLKAKAYKAKAGGGHDFFAGVRY